jgi:hypothetical protein
MSSSVSICLAIFRKNYAVYRMVKKALNIEYSKIAKGRDFLIEAGKVKFLSQNKTRGRTFRFS